jgi:DNA-binding NtrC family response regulator
VVEKNGIFIFSPWDSPWRTGQMVKKIIVLDADENQCGELCGLLQEQQYPVTPIHSYPGLLNLLQGTDSLVVIIDLDTVPIDNRTIRELVLKHPGTYLLCLSKDRFHPHLKEALCYHIYACLNKPVDLDELFYWLRSIHENDSDSTCKTEA